MFFLQFLNFPLTMYVTLIISRTSKKQNVSIERGEQLLKSLIIKRTQSPENVTESKVFQDSKKKASISAQNQDGKENKCKPVTNSKMCSCSPTTHEGSFRCRLHRISATKKSATEKSSNVRCSKFDSAEFKPQLSRFGRVASAEFGPHA